MLVRHTLYLNLYESIHFNQLVISYIYTVIPIYGFYTLQAYTDFQDQFNKLMLDLKKIENHHWLMSSHMAGLVRRMLNEKSFWAKKEIQQMVDLKFLPAR